jgi:CHAT domain-containing protein
MKRKKAGDLARIARFLSLLLLGSMLWILLSLGGRSAMASLPRLISTLDHTAPLPSQSPFNREAAVSAPSLIEQGKTNYQAAQFADAIDQWLQAKAMYEAQGDRLNQAYVLSYLALAYQQLGQWPLAETAIASSLDLLQAEEGSPNPAYQAIKGQVWNTQGTLQLAQGQAEEALTSWQTAATAYDTAGKEAQYIGSLINQAQAQQVLGFFLQARKTFDAIQQQLQRQTDLTIRMTGLRSLGNLLRSVGELDGSQTVLQESLAIARQLQSPQETSLSLLSLGNTARAQQDSSTALDLYRQAAAQATLPLTATQAQLNELNVLIETRQWPAATSLANQIQPHLSTLPLSRTTIYAYINFAQSLLKLSPPTPTSNTQHPTSNTLLLPAQVLATAIQKAKDLHDSQAEAYALGYLGSVYEQTQQWALAKQLTEEGLSLAQSVNALDISYQWQWQLGRIFKQQGDQKNAIASYATAYDTLQSLRRDLRAIDTSVQFSFKESVEPVYRQYVELLLQSADETQSPDALIQAREVMESLQLAELTNFFRSACLEGQRVTLEQVDQREAAVLYPIILPDRLDVILSLPHQPLKHYHTAIQQEEVESTLEDLRLYLERPFTAPEGKTLGKQVYDWLIQPIESDLAQSQVKILAFVLDGALRNVPMAALYDGSQYLVEHYAVAIAPGLRLLNPQPLGQNQLEALVAGLTEERHGFPPLRNVSLEVKDITAEVPSEVLLNQSFTSTALREQINRLPFPIVHLATHGQFSSNAAETFILAWDKPILIDELSDLLRTSDERRPKAIELLVLSACETATGDNRAALGLAGISVRAGARSTLASLWSLDDESGAHLIAEFYRQLTQARLNRAEALRQAQLFLLHDSNYRHPAQWASYVLVGNWL